MSLLHEIFTRWNNEGEILGSRKMIPMENQNCKKG